MQNEVIFLFALCYILDLLFGDPEWFPHPVRWMGKLINFLDNWLRGEQSNKWRERIKGVVLVVLVVGISGSFAYLFLELSSRINYYFGIVVWIYLGYTTISVKDLRVKAKAILKELKNNSLSCAQKELSKIVGRDTQNLDKEKIITATVESIAENTNDGIVAPLFYLALGGPVLSIIYKAINTLDSMLGYKNEKYIHFGWASAKLDDIVNYIPARITGVLIVIASSVVNCSLVIGYSSLKTILKYGKCHLSPNSGIPQAAVAGALGIRLGGPSFYQGIEIIKPYIGEEKRKNSILDIEKSLTISFTTSFLMLLLGVFFTWII